MKQQYNGDCMDIKRLILFRILLFIAIIIIATLFVFLIFHSFQRAKYSTISMESLNVLNSWTQLERIKNDFLVSGSSISPEGEFNLKKQLAQWDQSTDNFKQSFTELGGLIEREPSYSPLTPRLKEAQALWKTTFNRLQSVQDNLLKLEKAGLDEELFPRLLHNFYLKRDSQLLTFSDSVTIMNIINQFSILDISSKEFSRIVRELMNEIQIRSDVVSRRMDFISIFIAVWITFTAVGNILLLVKIRSLEKDFSSYQQIETVKELRGFLLDEEPKEIAGIYPYLTNLNITHETEAIGYLLQLNKYNLPDSEKKIIRFAENLSIWFKNNKTPVLAVPFSTSVVLFQLVRGKSFVETENQKTKTFLKSLQEFLKKEEEFYFSITAGRLMKFPAEARKMYRKLVAASQYRLIFGHHTILDFTMVEERENVTGEYPILKEKELTNLLKQGKNSQAKELYLEIVAELSKYKFNSLKNGLIRLIMAITTALDTLERINEGTHHIDILAFTSNVNSRETLEEINTDIIGLIDQIAEEVNTRRDNYAYTQVKYVNRIIEEEFSHPNLSSGTIAEKIGLSSSYLGRIYRKQIGVSIQEMINQRRMVEAKKLVEAEDTPFTEIAESVGISNTLYFYTLFKKSYGMTPKEYRINARIKQSHSTRIDEL